MTTSGCQNNYQDFQRDFANSQEDLPITCDLQNPLDAQLISHGEFTPTLVSTDFRADYIGHYLRVAVRQRFLNDSNKKLDLSYVLPLSENDTIYDFRVKLEEKIKGYNELNFTQNEPGTPWKVDLGSIEPMGELSVMYVYARLTEVDKSGRVTFFMKGSNEDCPDDSLESIGFFLRGGASQASIMSTTHEFFVDKIDHKQTYVCPNDENALQELIKERTKENLLKLEKGEMLLSDVLDMCPMKVNPVFSRDFVLILDDFTVDPVELRDQPADSRGDVITNALNGLGDNSKEYLMFLFLEPPITRTLLPYVEYQYGEDNTLVKPKLLNLSEEQATELLQYFEEASSGKMMPHGIDPQMLASFQNVLKVVLPNLPPRFEVPLWCLSFDPNLMVGTDVLLWAFALRSLLESNSTYNRRYPILASLINETVSIIPMKLAAKLINQLATNYTITLDDVVKRVKNQHN
jgi:hypothetical protein